ncbi:hypothetical protein P9Z62_02090 [Bacillus safensis subsp. safensis]
MFFDQKSYEEYDHLGLFIGEYSIEDAQIEEKGQQLFEHFLKENNIVG